MVGFVRALICTRHIADQLALLLAVVKMRREYAKKEADNLRRHGSQGVGAVAVARCCFAEKMHCFLFSF